MKVKFVPQNIEFEIKAGESVMHLAQDNGIYIKSVCKGIPSCAECRVRVVDGEHNVLPPASEELALIGTGHFIDRRRLSCQLKCFGDITVDMNEQIAKQAGLIGKKTKRQAAKDDRIEASVAIRSEIDAEEISDEILRGPSVSIEDQPVHHESGQRPSPVTNNSRPTSGPRPNPGGPRPQTQAGPRRDQVTTASDSSPNEVAGGEGSRKPRRRRRGGRGKGQGGGGGNGGAPGGAGPS
jgi:2Fe-2S ferredoxin